MAAISQRPQSAIARRLGNDALRLRGLARSLEAVSPLVPRQDIRYKFPDDFPKGEITLTLATSDAGDGNEHDFALWQNPRIVAPGWPDLNFAKAPARSSVRMIS